MTPAAILAALAGGVIPKPEFRNQIVGNKPTLNQQSSLARAMRRLQE